MTAQINSICEHIKRCVHALCCDGGDSDKTRHNWGVCLSVVPQIRLYRSLQCGADNGCKQHRRSAAMQSRVYSGDTGVYAMEDIWNATSKLGVIGVIAPDY